MAGKRSRIGNSIGNNRIIGARQIRELRLESKILAAGQHQKFSQVFLKKNLRIGSLQAKDYSFFGAPCYDVREFLIVVSEYFAGTFPNQADW